MSTFIECSKATSQSNEKIINTANNIDVQIAIELEEPWESIPLKSSHFPSELQPLAPLLAKNKINCGLNYFAKNIVNDKTTKIFVFKKNANEFLPYDKFEFDIPQTDLPLFSNELIAFIKDENKNILKWQIEKNNETIEIFICVHGTRDQCCGKYGIQLYHTFKETVDRLNLNYRIWKSSHIGGHRYAPTFFEAPSMRWYGLFTLNSVEAYLTRNQNNFSVINNYRGMSGISNKLASLIENELFKEYSWEWLNFSNKNYEMFDSNINALPMIHFFYSKDHKKYKRTYQITETASIENIASCGSVEKKSVKQYIIKEYL